MQEISDKRFVITGGSGLIGTRVAQTLLERGAAHVTLLDNLSLSALTHLDDLISDDRVTFVQADILDRESLTEAFDGADGVFAIAAFLVIPMSRDVRLGLNVNINGMMNVIEAARAASVGKVVFASSISVYGAAIDGLVSESSPFSSTDISPTFALYALSKLIGEQLGALYAASGGPEFSTVRFATVYGERQHERGLNALQIVKAYKAIQMGERPVIVGSGDDGHDFIYVGDAAEGMVRTMEVGRTGAAYNIATGRSLTTREAVEAVIRITGTDLRPRFVPDERGAAAPTLRESLHLDVSAAKTDLDWEAAVGIEEGIGMMISWLDRVE
ncbi:NAD-dependent epimerase/dehydratase family protein [Microbacterium soli]|uniref:NAD-dependent epimerase/dehydratase family protein n=1 Tax=Microbacterium soli TaxID=446075 RepID=A0ABP7MKM9_9MICO